MESKLKPHPVSEIMPMMDDEQYERLRDDIAENGVQSCGLLYEGMILDGRNRYRACTELNIPFDWQEVELGEDAATFDPVKYVLTHNLHRRHLETGQRSMIAARMAKLTRGGDRKSEKIKGSNDPLISDAATMLSVSDKSVKRAKHVIEHGSKELVQAVEQKAVTLNQAEKLCKACDDKREQTRLVKEGKQAIKEFLNPMPHESSIDVDADEHESIGEIGDRYEYQIVKMFKHADYRLNTLKMLLAELELHERNVLKDWLNEA